MTTQAIELNADLLRFLRPLTHRPLNELSEELMVMELYRRRQLSSGKAAEILNMERFEFIRYAARQGIAFFDMSDEEFASEAALVKTL